MKNNKKRCMFKGTIKFMNGRQRKFEGEIPLEDNIEEDGINVLDLKQFYNENPSINHNLLQSIDGIGFLKDNPNKEIRVIGL